MILGTSVMVLFTLLFVFAPSSLARPFTNLPNVLAVAVTIIPLAGVFQIFDGLQIMAAGVLRGAADTRAPMVIQLVGFWAFALPLAYTLAIVLHLGPAGLWSAIVVGLFGIAVVLTLRVRQRLSLPLERVRIDVADKG